MRKSKSAFLVLAVLAILCPRVAFAGPSGDFFMPTEVGGLNFFPIKVGGMVQFNSSGSVPTNNDDNTTSPICTCPDSNLVSVSIGMDVSFWSPAYLIEQTKTPYYSPALGQSISSSSDGKKYGAVSNNVTHPQTFQQSHFIRYPLMDVLGLLHDFKCIDRGKTIDYLWLTEAIPWKQDGLLAALMTPDSYLFANPVAIASCIPESASAQVDYIMPYQWWCMGAWGTVYPLANFMGIADTTTASAALAGKSIFELSRDMALLDHATAPYCQPVPKPIWDKSHFKLQLVRPVNKPKAVVIGKSSLFWGSNSNPPYKAGNNSNDEFLYVLYQKYHCCEPIVGSQTQ